VGSDGPFTGAVNYLGEALFFKENCLHRVWGSYPSEFRVLHSPCRGVAPGCGGSLSIVGETLYYKATSGICAYDGSLPVEISNALGERLYEAAVGCAHGNKYYVSMNRTDGTDLFAYDTVKGMWHREDDLRARLLCSCRDELYCATEDGRILTMLGSGEAYEEKVPWMFETGILGVTLPEKKYLVKINLRLVLEPGSTMHISAQYDSVGQWHDLGFITGTDLRSFVIPVKPRRCDHLRLRVEAEGRGIVSKETGYVTGHKKIQNMTYWAVYEPVPGGIPILHSGYAHRMNLEGE
jgi:hypothetical protein